MKFSPNSLRRGALALLMLSFTIAAAAQSAKKLHYQAIVVDTHNDVITTSIEDKLRIDSNLKGRTHSDLDRFKEGGVDVQIFSIWCDGTYKNGQAYARANREIDTLYALAARNPGKMLITRTPADLKKAVKQNKLAAMMGVEGGHMIESRLDYIDSLFNRGVRYMTLTWNNSTDWATSAMDETGINPEQKLPPDRKRGLTDFGKQVVKRMNELGMIVDLSHVGEHTFWDAIETTTKPVIASHSCSYTLCPIFRNLKDDQIRAIAKNGGVIHLNFFSGFVDPKFMARDSIFRQKHKQEYDSLLKLNPEPYFATNKLFTKYADEVMNLRPPMSMLLDHLDYIVKLVGVDHVGLGSDFDGITSSPQQLDDVTNLPLITEELLKRGYSKKDIKKILGGNFIRVFEANSK